MSSLFVICRFLFSGGVPPLLLQLEAWGFNYLALSHFFCDHTHVQGQLLGQRQRRKIKGESPQPSWNFSPTDQNGCAPRPSPYPGLLLGPLPPQLCSLVVSWSMRKWTKTKPNKSYPPQIHTPPPKYIHKQKGGDFTIYLSTSCSCLTFYSLRQN
jgi:hypothetical protein